MARTSKRARKSSPLHLPGAFDLFKPSKEIVIKNIWIFGPLYAVPLILGIHGWIWSPAAGQPQHWWNHANGLSSGWPGSPLPTYDSSVLIGFSILWLLFVLVAGTVASIMSQAAQLDAAQHRHLDFQNFWQVVKQMGLRLLGLYVVTGVIVVVGLFLLIVPGLIFLRRYFLAPYVMIDKNLSISDSLSRSAEISRANTGAIWGVFGVMALIALIGIIPIIGGLISFIVGSLYSVAPAMRYEQLKKLA
jgi:hypothetical protein